MGLSFADSLGHLVSKAKNELTLADKMRICLDASTPALRRALAEGLSLESYSIAELMLQPYPEVDISNRLPLDVEAELRVQSAHKEARVDAVHKLKIHELEVVYHELVYLWSKVVPAERGVASLPLWLHPLRSHGNDAATDMVKLATPGQSGEWAHERIRKAVEWWRAIVNKAYASEYVVRSRSSLEWLATRGVDAAPGRKQHEFEYLSRLLNGSYDNKEPVVE